MVLLFRKIITTNLTILLLFQVYLLFSCSERKGADFEIRLAPDQVTSSAAYGNILFHGSKDLSLSRIECEGYASVEWHESRIDEKGVMHMKRVAFPRLVMGQKVYSFSRGGDHLMLIGRTRKIVEGETLLLTFYFSDDSRKQIQAKVTK